MTIHSPIQTPAAPAARSGTLPAGPLAELFALQGAPLRVARNEEIYGAEEPAEYVYLIVEGTVRTCRFTADGRRQIAAFLSAGDVIGLEAGESYRHSAEAVTGATLLMVSRAAINASAARELGLARALWTFAASEIARADDHLTLLGRRGAEERVAAFLLGRAGMGAIELPMSRQDIADYLGLTIETVSRTMTQLERDRVIAMPSARRIELKSRSALVEIADGV